MSQELTLNFTAQYSDSLGQTDGQSVVDQLIDVAAKRLLHGTQLIPTGVDTVLIRGGVQAAQLYVIINRDPTNFVTVKNGNGGLAIAKLKPGRFCVIPPGADMLTPYAVADTGACEVEVLVFDT